MGKSMEFSPEVRERAVRLVQEHRGEYTSLWAAVESIAPKIGCGPQTLLGWVQRDEIDNGVRALSEHQRIHGAEMGGRNQTAERHGAQAAGRREKHGLKVLD